MYRLTFWLIIPIVAAATARVWAAEAPPTSRPAVVNLLTWGDWGDDTPERPMVADALTRYVQKAPEPIDAALLVGDNFKIASNGSEDVLRELFDGTYDAKIMNFPFYVALGNHDYEQDKCQVELAYAKNHPESRWKQPAKWYRVELPVGAAHPLVTMLVLDSDKQELSDTDWATEHKWLADQLAGKRAQWTICAAHHTMFSNGVHGDNGVLKTDWGPLFTQYKVDFYICGHDHTLQHLEIPDWPTSFIVSGGGGASMFTMLRDDRGPFFKSEYGFAHLRFDAQKAEVEFIDINDAVAHSFQRRADGTVKTISTTPNGKKTSHPLRAIQGIPDTPPAK